MQLQVIKSSSAANAYLLTSSTGETLMIEAGLMGASFQKVLASSGPIVGALVTHEHSDHARCAHKLTERCIPVYASQGTIDALQQSYGESHFYKVMPPKETITVGSFRVFAIPAFHDAAQPFAFLIWHREMGTLLFATDTYKLPYRLNAIDHMMIECNYQGELLQQAYDAHEIDKARFKRTVKSHLSLATLKVTLAALSVPARKRISNICLLHLSAAHSNAAQMQDTIQRLCPTAQVNIAQPGLTIKLNKPS